jgi:predicted membrane protein (TIGR00267 family)
MDKEPVMGGEIYSPPNEEAPKSRRSRSPKYQEKHKHISGRGLISSSALGLTDGLVTNLSFLTGFSGAAASIDLIRFAGIAAVLAGSVSMMFGGILAARSEFDLFEADSKREAYEIENERDEEVAELKNLYREKGLSEEEANLVVTKITSNKEKFLEDMLANELHMHRSRLENPYKVGAVVGLSFFVGAFVPLIPYLIFSLKVNSLTWSVILSLAFLFAAGAWKGRIAKKQFWRSGLETLVIGAVAAAVLYTIGTLLVFI